MSEAAEAAEVLDPRIAALESQVDRLQQQLEHCTRSIQAWQAAEARTLAQLDDVARSLSEVIGGDVPLHRRSVAAQVALPFRLSDRLVEDRMVDAAGLCNRWPSWLAAFEDGEIAAEHLRVLQRLAVPIEVQPDLDAAAVDRFAAEALAVAREVSPGRLEPRVRRLADALVDAPLTVRHRAARAARCVWVVPDRDGMSVLGMRVPSVLASAIDDRLTQIARSKPDDDPRTIGNVRADTACELLLTGADAAGLPGFGHVRGVVHVTVPAETLRRVDRVAPAQGEGRVEPVGQRPRDGHERPDALDALPPADLDGEPLDPESARMLAALATRWRSVSVDPATGGPGPVTTRTPSAAQREWLGLRDGTCRFPGCTSSAWRCDLDHTIPWDSGGGTSTGNLAHLCRRHHTLKHHGDGTAWHWKVEHLGHGVLAWTDPVGRVYVDTPTPIGPSATRPVFTDVDPPPATPPPVAAASPGPPPF